MPDCVRALLARARPILVRSPAAVRPWQHVLECLSGYLWLGARLGAEGKNSPLATAFQLRARTRCAPAGARLVEEILTVWPGQWVDGSSPDSPHEATLLSLSIDKAAALLDWHPVWDFHRGHPRKPLPGITSGTR